MSTDPDQSAAADTADDQAGNDQPAVQRTPSGVEMLLELMGDRPVRFWVCAKDGHGSSLGGPPRETVRWIDNVAHCMTPGCGRTSLDPQPEWDEPEWVEVCEPCSKDRCCPVHGHRRTMHLGCFLR